MIQTKDNKKLFTYAKNYKYLIEYAKTFNAKIFNVKIDKNQKVLELSKLVMALCDKNYKIKNLNFEIISTKFTNKLNKKIKIKK
jgi:hypothetical protein